MGYSQAFQKMLDSGEFDLVRGVPIFDAHSEFDEKGNLVRRFGKDDLQRICDKTNARARTSGTLALVAPGHTVPKAPETAQPEPWGYADHYRVEPFGAEHKPTIHVDWLVRKSKAGEAKTYPHRSVELWPRDGIIDWIAQLRRAPQRDLGILRWSKNGQPVPYGPTESFFSDASLSKPLSAVLREDAKLCYSMETSAMPLKYEAPVDDPTKVPDAAKPGLDDAARQEDEEHQKFSKHCDKYMKSRYSRLDEMHKKFDEEFPPEEKPLGEDGKARLEAPAAPASPSGTNVTMPKFGDDDKEKDRMSKDSAAIQYARLEADIALLKQAKADADKAANLARAEQIVQQLEFQGISLDRAYEVEQFAKRNPDEQVHYRKRIENHYKRDGAGLPPVGGRVDVEGDAGPVRYSRDMVEKAVAIAEREGISYEKALAQVSGK